MIALLKDRRFLPLFIAQFLGALNDNLFKNALAILVVFKLVPDPDAAQALAGLATALFVLPYFFASAFAGTLADRMPKASLTQWVRLIEVPALLLGLAGLVLGSIPLLFAALIGMGILSTFFSPVKFSLLPELLKPEDLARGNALFAATTFVAILIGTIMGTELVRLDGGPWIAGLTGLGIAVLAWLACRALPPTVAVRPDLRLRWNFLADTWAVCRGTLASPVLRRVVLGISWFWMLGAVLLAQLPGLVRNRIGADEQVVTFFLALFSIGIAVGAGVCGRMLRGQVKSGPVGIGALGMALATVDLWLALPAAPVSNVLTPLPAFLAEASNWRLIGDFLLLAVAGGVYTVPLYTLLQSRAQPEARARAVATNNIVNAGMMGLGTAGTALLPGLGLTVPDLVLALGVGLLILALPLARTAAQADA